MNALPIIELAELQEYFVDSDNYQNVLSVVNVDVSVTSDEIKNEDYSSPVRLNALFMILVLQGSAKISLDYVHYTVSTDTFIIIMPTHIFQVAGASSDFKARLIVVDKSFIDELNTEKRSPSMTNYMMLRKNPCTELLPEETTYINNAIQILCEKIRLRTHSFHKEVMQNAFVGFMLEMANVLIGKNDTMVRPTLSRKEEILNDFLQLLFAHSKEEHSVAFYAEKLFITPQYLSLILKELTGKSANKWIDDVLLTEAKILLKMPQITVQQVADQLNFSDQSTFGKFFKKQMGMSPMEYRKS
ncbi:AraC family transcriptional regulator [Parabacteroides sp. 52]|uniref:helix-turn-helix domain-containing protein n=1 Tax=unclassified Parabacteroides TaxID=2649774 RepID=UPI0013D13AAE|nr:MULTISPECIES: AraC family transcriptional regulator [unclassified Parabacteroides]MDH6533638.1 AraC family transcriptional activator of pobA [Parabacteroides sp. PM5-20]NDV54390.1 AraC family transcriptional regulator [Parabacteroides sp. 52]